MSLVDAIVTSIASNLGISVSKGADAGTLPATGADNNFKALLAIGSEDPKPVEDKASNQDQPGRDDKEQKKDQGPAYNAAAVVNVPAPVVPASNNDNSNANDNTPPASDAPPAVDNAKPAAQPQSNDKPDQAGQPAPQAQAKADNASDTGKDNRAQAATDATSKDTGNAGQDDAAGVDDLRKALADQFGNIAAILEAFIQQLAGSNTVSTLANADVGNDSAAFDISSLTDGTQGSDAQSQIDLFKQILAIVRQLQQALLNAAANGQQGAIVIQQDITVTTTVQSTTGTDNNTQDPLANINQLLDQLNARLSALIAAFPPQDTSAQDPALAASADPLPQLADLKAQLKDSISQIRQQLDQLSNANENAYNNTLNRFQALLGVSQQQDDSQSKSLLKQALDLLAQATGASDPKDSKITVQAAAAPVTDKNSIAPNTIIVNNLPNTVVPDVQSSSSNTGGQQNNSGGNGQNFLPSIGSVSAATPGSVSTVGDATFQRALALTADKPIPEQISVQIKTAVADGSSKITIQLQPDDLGKLDIKLNVKADGKTGVVITADNNTTLNLLQRDAQQLLRALQDAGLQTDSGSLSFNLRGDQQGQQGNSQMTGNYQKAQPGEDDDVLIQAVTRQYTINLNDGLDITI